MSIVKEILKREVLEPALNKRILTLAGWVLYYNRDNNTMDVSVIDPRSGGKMILRNVLYCVSIYGFHGIEPRTGFRVLVSFDGGDMSSPKVVSTFDENFNREGGPLHGLSAHFSASSEGYTDESIDTFANPSGGGGGGRVVIQ